MKEIVPPPHPGPCHADRPAGSHPSPTWSPPTWLRCHRRRRGEHGHARLVPALPRSQRSIPRP